MVVFQGFQRFQEFQEFQKFQGLAGLAMVSIMCLYGDGLSRDQRVHKIQPQKGQKKVRSKVRVHCGVRGIIPRNSTVDT